MRPLFVYKRSDNVLVNLQKKALTVKSGLLIMSLNL